MMRYALMILTFLFLLPGAASAEMKYYADPVYKKLNDEDSHPMDPILELAKGGDARAQFMLGDMYAKGKGGLPKDRGESRRWFEESAIHGYGPGFIRLAALAKHENRPAEAWQWYSLAIDTLDYGDEQRYAIQARRELTEKAQLSPEDIDGARDAKRAWEQKRTERLRAEREEEEKRRREEKENGETPAADSGQQPPQKERTDE